MILKYFQCVISLNHLSIYGSQNQKAQIVLQNTNIFFIYNIRLGINVALTHQNRSYRNSETKGNQGKRRGIENEADRGKRQEEDRDN